MRCETLKERLIALDMRLHDTLIQADDMNNRNVHHSSAQKEYSMMNKEIEAIISMAHGPRHRADKSIVDTMPETWVPSDYIERIVSLKKFGKTLEAWQVKYEGDGTLPDGASVKALWAKIIAVEAPTWKTERLTLPSSLIIASLSPKLKTKLTPNLKTVTLNLNLSLSGGPPC